jgi:RNA-binding protein 25
LADIGLFVLIWTLVASSVVRFRSKWRSERQRPRRQEYQDDVRDRQREADEQAALEKETEDLFKRQMDEMADIEAKGRAAGLLFEDAKPIKVAIGAPAPLLPSGTNASVATSSSVAAVKTETKPKVAAARGNAASAFGAEDDDEDVKKKRTLVRLDEDAGVKSNIEAKTQAKLTAIRNGIPKSPAELWSLKLRWEGLSSVRVFCRGR